MTALIEGINGRADEDALVAAIGPPHDLPDRVNPFEAAPPLVSLLSTAVDVTAILDGMGQGRAGSWVNGITFEPEVGALNLAADYPYYWTCPPAVVANPSRAWSENSPGGIKNIPDAPSTVLYTPYVAHTADPCISTFGMFARDGHARARRLLEANLSRILENELWTGARSLVAGWANNYLLNSPSTPNGNTATGFINALADLEQAYFAIDNRPGFIHVQPRIVALWRAFDLITPSASGRQLVTALGNYVIPGTGYPGSGTGLVAGTHAASWAYMTGPIAVARTEVFDQTNIEAEMVNRTTNERDVRAEAYVAAFWDGKANVAVKIDHLTETS